MYGNTRCRPRTPFCGPERASVYFISFGSLAYAAYRQLRAIQLRQHYLNYKSHHLVSSLHKRFVILGYF